MPKRKQVAGSEEDEAFETPSEDERPKKSKQKAKATTKKPKFEDSDVDSDEERPMKSKKTKEKEKAKAKTPAKSAKDAPSDSVEVDSNGDKYIELGKKKRATVRSFKGQAFVDIREYYGQEGDEKPGKKGISLSPEQWETLKSGADTIDVLLAKLSKK